MGVKQQIKAAFDLHDTDGSGCIDSQMLEVTVTAAIRMGESQNRMDNSQIRSMVDSQKFPAAFRMVEKLKPRELEKEEIQELISDLPQGLSFGSSGSGTIQYEEF